MNWCPGLGTVVANEEVTADGRSDRGNFPVFKRNMRQWMMRITTYADRLIDDLELLDWTERSRRCSATGSAAARAPRCTSRTMIDGTAAEITVFTTRPDTLFGATFMVLAPEHPLVDALTTPEQADAVADYRAQAGKPRTTSNARTRPARRPACSPARTPPTRSTASRSRCGSPTTCSWATAPGAIMAVPCGDQRDFEFARKFGLPIVAIQQPPDAWFAGHGIEPTLDTARGPRRSSATRRTSQSPTTTSTSNGIATKAEGIELHERVARAQHGTATPRSPTSCATGCSAASATGASRSRSSTTTTDIPHALPDDLLPVLLPETESFSPRTFDADDEFSNPESPLDRLGDWVEVELDLDPAATARRSTAATPT